MTWCLLLAGGALLLGVAIGLTAGILWIALKMTMGGR